MTETNRLRIAMQKSGRLSDDSQDLLERCGLKVRYHAQRLLAMAENMPVEILRVRDDDIPGLVMDGVVDLGIIGENVLEETVLARRSQGQSTDFRMLRRFDFGGCRLSIAIPAGSGRGLRASTAAASRRAIRSCSSAASTSAASRSGPAC